MITRESPLPLEKHGGHRGRNALGKGLGHAVVGGDGELYGGVAGKDDHPNAVLFQTVEEFVDRVFCPLKAVRFEIFGQHRVGDVDGEHHLDALALLFTQLRPELRAGCGEDQQRDGRREEDEFQLHAPRRNVGHEEGYRLGIAETRQSPPPVVERPKKKGDQRGYCKQQIEVFGMCETKHYGMRLRIRVRSRNSVSRRASAANTQIRYSSV